MIIPALHYRADESLQELAAHDSGVVTLLQNGIPVLDGFYVAPTAEASRGTTAAQPRGGFRAKKNDGEPRCFVADNATVYEINHSSSTAATVGSAPSGGVPLWWEFTQFNDIVLAVSGGRPVSGTSSALAMNVDSGTSFSAIAGAPNASSIATVKDFVVMGSTYDPTDGKVYNRVRWSAIGNHESWTVSAVTQADYTDLAEGVVQRIIGGERGYVFTESGVYLMTYVGTPLVFQMDRLAGAPGTVAPHSVVNTETGIFYLGPDGFRLLSHGGGSTRIGKDSVDEAFGDIHEFDDDVMGVKDPNGSRIIWKLTSSTFAVFDYMLNRWGKIVHSSEDPSITYYLSPYEEPLNDKQMLLIGGAAGGSFALHPIDISGKYSSSYLPFVADSGIFPMDPYKRAVLTEMSPISRGTSALKVALLASASADVPGHGTEAGDTAMQSSTYNGGTGKSHLRVEGRFFKLRATIEASSFKQRFGGWILEKFHLTGPR